MATWYYTAFEEKHRQGWRFEAVELGAAGDRSGSAGHVSLIRIRSNGALSFVSVEEGVSVLTGAGDRILVMVPPMDVAGSASSRHAALHA